MDLRRFAFGFCSINKRPGSRFSGLIGFDGNVGPQSVSLLVYMVSSLAVCHINLEYDKFMVHTRVDRKWSRIH